MSVVTIFSSVFCRKEEVLAELERRTGYRLVTDEEVADRAATMSGLDSKRILRALSSKTSVFDKFTREKERGVAWLRMAMADMLSEDGLLFDGVCGHLIPRAITHVLQVCLVADMKSRVAWAEASGLSAREATSRIRAADEDRASWVDRVRQVRDPWASSLYDIVIPTDKMDVDASVAVIVENLRSDVLGPTETSRRAAEDFGLAARVGVALVREGHNVDVEVRDRAVTLTVNQNVLMLGRLQEELKGIASKVPGVSSVETRIGKGFHRTDIYRKYDFDVPKLLLVDDEREFVHTLSERLQIRDVNAAVTYDGQTALEIVEDDEPEVMILDLKMPGIDGIEVLKNVKATRPNIEVIILTGHGSEEDRRLCLSLGAFAYLQKPVDIEVLTETLRAANERIRRKSAGDGNG